MIEVDAANKTIYLSGDNNAAEVLTALMKAGGTSWKEWNLSDDYFYGATLAERYDVPNAYINICDLFNYMSPQ